MTPDEQSEFLRRLRGRLANVADLQEFPPGSGVFMQLSVAQVTALAQEKTGFKAKLAKKLQEYAEERRAAAAVAEVERIAAMSLAELAGLIGFALGRRLWNRFAQRTIRSSDNH